MIPRAVLALTMLFEHGTPTPQYDKCENLHDGRGWTCGAFGFTEEETKDFHFPARAWHLLSFNDVWKEACKEEAFKNLQLRVAEEEFLVPALDEMKRRGLKHFLTMAVFFDTLVQHGAGADADSFYAIVRGWDNSRSEIEELAEFLNRRERVLMNPKNKDTAKEWGKSVDRVKVFRQFLGQRVDEVKLTPNIELRLPLELQTSSYSLVIK